MARSIALLAIIAPASGHFVWLSANGHGEAVAEFNEPGRLTDPHLLGKLYNMTRGQVHTMEGTTSDLHFMTRGAGDGYHCAAEVYAPLPQQGSMAVEAQATYGLYAVGTDEGANVVDGAAVVGAGVAVGTTVGARVNGTTKSCESPGP